MYAYKQVLEFTFPEVRAEEKNDQNINQRHNLRVICRHMISRCLSDFCYIFNIFFKAFVIGIKYV